MVQKTYLTRPPEGSYVFVEDATDLALSTETDSIVFMKYDSIQDDGDGGFFEARESTGVVDSYYIFPHGLGGNWRWHRLVVDNSLNNAATASAPVDTSSGNYQIGSDEFQVRLRVGASDPVLPLGGAGNDGQWYVIENYSGAARTPTTLSSQTLEASSLIPIGERRAFAWDNVASTWRVM